MIKRTRLIILIVCVVCFFVITPILVFYSMGYRFNFEKMEITATGGIYVRTFPAAGQIVIDSKISEKPGLFSNSIFVQSLIPKNHTVLVAKQGYYDYSKIIPVEKNQVTKLENILLVKSALTFAGISDKVDYFSTAPNNQNIITAYLIGKNISFNYFKLGQTSKAQIFSISQTGNVSDIKWSDDSHSALIKIDNQGSISYYLVDATNQKLAPVRLSYLDRNSQQISFNPQDSLSLFYIKNRTLYSAKGDNSLPIINSIISFKTSGSNIIWLSTKGALNVSDLSGKSTSPIISKNLTLDSSQTYKITSVAGNTFLESNKSLFELNQRAKSFEDLDVPTINYKLIASSDNKNLVLCNARQIYLYSLADKKYNKLFSGENITDCQWLNNNYIIFTDGNKIIISEIDYRGNINVITLPQTITTQSDQTIAIKNPKMFFNPQDGKVYILTNNTFITSEKINP